MPVKHSLNSVLYVKSLVGTFNHDFEIFANHCLKLYPAVEDGEYVVAVLGAAVARLQEHLHLPQVLALLQQRDRVVLASVVDK